MFEICTIVSDIHDDVELILNVTYFVELEEEIGMRKLQLKFLNRSVPVILYTKE